MILRSSVWIKSLGQYQLLKTDWNLSIMNKLVIELCPKFNSFTDQDSILTSSLNVFLGNILFILVLTLSFKYRVSFFCHLMSDPYVIIDSNHISFQLFAKFSKPDFLARCLHDSSAFFCTTWYAFLSACSSLSASVLNKGDYSQRYKRSLTEVQYSSIHSYLFCIFSIFPSSLFLFSWFCTSSYNFSFPLLLLLVLLLFFTAAFLIEGQNKWEKCQGPLSALVDQTCWRTSGLQGIGFIVLLAWMELSGSAYRVPEHNFLLPSSIAAVRTSVSVCVEYGEGLI